MFMSRRKLHRTETEVEIRYYESTRNYSKLRPVMLSSNERGVVKLEYPEHSQLKG